MSDYEKIPKTMIIMKKYKFMFRISGILAIIAMMIACEPQMAEKPDIGLPPSDDQLDFTITPGSDAYRFVMTNTSSVTGIPSWDLGNGSKSGATVAVGYYPLPGTYTVTMTLVTRGGTVKKSKTLTTTETDYSIFNDPVTIALSGGIAATDGKTWAIDSLAPGHMSVGPGGTDGTSWWAAAPLEKSAAKVLYDDLLTFKLDGFVVTYVNHGKSFVKGGRETDPAYSNPVATTGDWAVDYPNPQPGVWSLEKRGSKTILKLAGSTPIFPCYDAGAKDGEYEIVSIDENFLDLLCTDQDGNARRTKLIHAGYVKPTITYTVNATEGVDNDVACSVTGYTIPAGESVTGIVWNFGDGSSEVTGGKDEVVHHVYMRKGTYTVTAKLSTSLGTLTGTKTVVLLNNNSAYVPFLLNMMIVYNDFSEVQTFPVLGQDCSVTIVDNPDKAYPNKTSKVAFYSKTDNQWANAYMQLGPGYRFDLRLQQVFSIFVYGTAGQQILLKLENTDRGGNAWQTGTYDLIYTIKESNKWELARYDFNGVGAGWDWTGDIFTSNIVTDDRFNHDFYNVIRIMCNPGNGTGTHAFYFDELSGPHVEGIVKK
jgi:PKD repeat protein